MSMKVIAAPGTRCPMEGKPREYVTDSEPVDVPESSYYNRLLKDGSIYRADVVLTPPGKPVKRR